LSLCNDLRPNAGIFGVSYFTEKPNDRPQSEQLGLIQREEQLLVPDLSSDGEPMSSAVRPSPVTRSVINTS
jgi:hypothetical protein